MTGSAPIGLRLLRLEGIRSLAERFAERADERRRQRSFRPSTLVEAANALGAGGLLNVLSSPFSARYGGVPIALAERLAHERATRPIALLSWESTGWRLEVESGTSKLAVALGGEPWHPFAGPEAPARMAEIRAAIGALAPGLVHFESVDGLPTAELAELAATLPLAISVHDYALFCRRPNLLQRPDGEFCGFCRDLERCGRCLAVDDARATSDDNARRREGAASLLARAAAVVHVSESARRSLRELFPRSAPRRERVIPPAVDLEPPRRAHTPGWPPKRVAFVGQAAAHKGVLEFAAAAAALRARHPEIGWSVLGGGPPAELAAARREGIEVLGFFRARKLLRRLAEARVDLAVLPSKFPETHSLVLDACVRAGVPVVAAAIGALADRVPELAAGWVYDAGRGVDGLSAALAERLGEPSPPPSPDAARISDAAAAAAVHSSLYREIDAR
jgi:glycosyltransferase involved in cell wall biosynthesis